MEKIVLMAHNGVAGKNAIAPFKGAEFINEPEGASEMEYAGRTFTRAFNRIEGNEEKVAYFREVAVGGEPSDWAKANG